jgi:hypothetical protein
LILESGRRPRRLTPKEICSDRPRRRIAERTRLQCPPGLLSTSSRQIRPRDRLRRKRKTTSPRPRPVPPGCHRPLVLNPGRGVANPTRLRRRSSNRNDLAAAFASRPDTDHHPERLTTPGRCRPPTARTTMRGVSRPPGSRRIPRVRRDRPPRRSHQRAHGRVNHCRPRVTERRRRRLRPRPRRMPNGSASTN